MGFIEGNCTLWWGSGRALSLFGPFENLGPSIRPLGRATREHGLDCGWVRIPE